jgi:hypothetical protein
MINYDQAYWIVSFAVLPFWLLLLLAPGWIWTQRLVNTAFVPLGLATLYLAFALPGFLLGGIEGGGFMSLEQLARGFQHPPALLAGWVHYLVFDLFIGAWIVRDALRHAIGRLTQSICLIFTLMLGPIGLGLYLIVRGVRRKRWRLDEGVAP